MSQLPICPTCRGDNINEYRYSFVCPVCGIEWSKDLVVEDANGTILHDGDDVTVIKDLEVKGSSSRIKVGTKIEDIRLVEGNDGHNIDCKVAGVGAIKLKQEFVKKS